MPKQEHYKHYKRPRMEPAAEGTGMLVVDEEGVTVEFQEDYAIVALRFPREGYYAITGDEVPLLEVRLLPPPSGQFRPWTLLPMLPMHLKHARAALTHDPANIDAALELLQKVRQVQKTRRGLSDDELRIVAGVHDQLVKEGEPYPIKQLAKHSQVHISTASRWITEARKRGLIDG